MNQYSSFFSALKRLPGLSKEEAVYDFTQGRTRSLRTLTVFELQELTRRLTNLAGHPQQKPFEYPGGEKADKMRKAIIAIFRKMGRPTATAIAWAEKQGAKGHKKRFNDYTTGELYILIGIAEKVLGDWEKGVRKQIEKL